MEKNYTVGNMHCASCAANVEHAASHIDGVNSANVNLLTENLRVDYQIYNEETENKVMQSVASLGYEIIKGSRMRSQIMIDGMHCASCSTNVEKTLNNLEGVNSVFVNLTTEQATMEYNPERISLEEIHESIEALGYQMILDGNAPDASEEHKKSKRRLYSLFALAIPLFLISMGPMMGISSLRKLEMNYPVLVAVGTGAAFAYSLYNSIRIILFGANLPLYFESVGVIIALINLGKYFEGNAKRRT